MLWVYSCLELLLYWCLFGPMWSFLRSWIWVCMLLVEICSFHEWWWISWTRIHVFHHGPSFSNEIFFNVILSKSMCIFTFSPLSSSSSFTMLLVGLFFFLLCSLGYHMLLQNCSVSLASGCWYVFISHNLLKEFSFVVLEYSVLTVLFYP